MDTPELRKELSMLRGRESRLMGERNTHQERATQANSADRWDQASADFNNKQVTSLEYELANVRSRITSLEKHLPSEDEVKAAHALALELLKQAEAHRVACNAWWSELLPRLGFVIEAARAVNNSHTALLQTITRIAELKDEFDLILPPVEPRPVPHFLEMNLVRTSAEYLREVSTNQLGNDAPLTWAANELKAAAQSLTP
jgi:hypothetical protein